MKNREIAWMFDHIADILEIKKGNPFKIRAYRKASLNLLGLTQDLAELSHKELLEIPGVGEDLAAKIEEYLQAGIMASYEQLKGEIPAGVFTLLAVPGLGPKTAKSIYDQTGVASLEELEQVAAEHRLAGMRGIQQKTEENILKGIAAVKRGRERQPLGARRSWGWRWSSAQTSTSSTSSTPCITGSQWRSGAGWKRGTC